MKYIISYILLYIIVVIIIGVIVNSTINTLKVNDISTGTISATGNINTTGDIYTDSTMKAIGDIHTDSTLKANNVVLKNNGNNGDVLADVLAVDKDNKIYKTGKLWNSSYTTPDNWVQPENDITNKFKDFTKDSKMSTTLMWESSCKPNQYVCGVQTGFSAKNYNKITYGNDVPLDPSYSIGLNMRCCDFPEGFPGRYPDPDEQK